MNWNPFKRIAELERMHTQNISVLNSLVNKLNDLTFKLEAQGKDYISKYNNMSIMLKGYGEHLISLQNQVIHRTDATRPNAPIGLTAADVEKEAKRRLQRAAYSRKYYAQKKKAAAAGGAK